MYQIKNYLLKNIYTFGLSKIDQVLLLDLIQISDTQGNVSIYYKDLVNQIGCMTASFYNSLHRLKKFGFIRFNKDNDYKAEIKVTIIGNDFENYEYDKDKANYVDINTAFFTNRMYNHLKSGEIRTLLYLFYRTAHSKSQNLKYRKKIGTYKTISKALQITERMCKIYMRSLNKLKFITILSKQDDKNTNFDIIRLNESFTQESNITVTEHGKEKTIKCYKSRNQFLYYVITLCRRFKVSYTCLQELDDVAILINQYKHKSDLKHKNIFAIMKNSIRSFKNSYLNSRILHSLVKNMLYADNNDLIVY